MQSIIDACFMCTKDLNCVPVDDRIVSQVEYLLPEITVVKLGIPLRICAICEVNLNSFNTFKQIWVENNNRLEATIKASQYTTTHAHNPSEILGEPDHKFEYTTTDFLNPQLPTGDNITDNVEQPFYHVSIKQEFDNDDISDKQEEHDTKDPNDGMDAIENLEIEIEESLDIKTDNDDSESETSDPKFEAVYVTENILEENEPDVSKKHRCTICNKKFAKRSYLKAHINVHTASKQFPCSFCNKIFLRKHILKVHMKHHSGIKDYKCEQCDKSFVGKSELKRHEKTHIGVKEHQCVTCKKMFTNISNLKMHMKIHSGKKSHHCTLCEKSFTRNYDLTVHMKIHNDEKDFQCDLCDKAFVRKTQLQSHMKTHLGIKDLSCRLCDKRFIHSNGLREHMKSHHTSQT